MVPPEPKVYITRNNSNQITQFYVREILKTIGKPDAVNIYKEDLSWILSTIDFKYLYIEQLVCSESDILKETERSLRREEGRFLFVSKSPPKYHRQRDCEYMHADYTNFSIPPEIEEKGAAHIEKFRRFAEENKKVLYEDANKFLDMLEARFLLKNRPTRIEFNNSGSQEFSRLDIDELEAAIDEHLQKARKFSSENPDIKNLQYAPARYINNNANPGVTSSVKTWHADYRSRLKSMLREYIKKSNNPDFSYTKNFLKSLGFDECHACAELDLSP